MNFLNKSCIFVGIWRLLCFSCYKDNMHAEYIVIFLSKKFTFLLKKMLFLHFINLNFVLFKEI
ncbi:hypothetical protein AD998_13630 [bacterium 336/3]|nr:hypothetical protein AD998_13630 [bacterium 336/3]